MVTRFWLCSRFFEFRGRGREMGETNVELEILPMCGQWSVMAIGRSCALSFRDLVYFFFFFFYMRIGNLEPSCKFQRASRPKKEDRRGPTNCREEGCNEWLLIFWIFFWVQRMGSHCYYYVIVLVSVVIVVVLSGHLHAGPSS